MQPLKLKTSAQWNLFLSFVLILVPAAFGREQLTFQRSASDAQPRAANTYLDQNNPTGVNGGSPNLSVLSLSGANQRALVLFDLSALPNVGVKSATLTLNITGPPTVTRLYDVHRLTSFFTETDASWNYRFNAVPWGTAGGDFNPTATASATVTPSDTTTSWDITADLQSWYNNTNPTYGTLIKDDLEDDASGVVTVFSSKEDPTDANHPQLTLTFLQNVTNLSATPGNSSVTLNWGYPTPIGTVLEANTGVLILRRADRPVDKLSLPTDGAAYNLCDQLNTGTVVFSDSANATTFTDDATDPCGAPANGTMWFYKVFIRDTSNYYTSNGGTDGSVSTAEVSAMPNSTPATQQQSLWITATYSTNLAAPGLSPGSVALLGSGTNLLFGVDPNTGARLYPAIATGGAITGRPGVIPAGFSSLRINVSYVPNQDSNLYAIDAIAGQIVWIVNPTGLATNTFQGSAAVQLKAFSGPGYTLTNDLAVLGTSDTTTATANQIVGVDGNTGAVVWQLVGNSGGNPAMDVVVAGPSVDYVNNAIWATSHSNGGTQPSLWKIDPSTGALDCTANLGDISSSPTITASGDVLFVGNDSGVLYAIDPATCTTLNSFNGGDSRVIGFPSLANFASPYLILLSGATSVQAVSYNTSGSTFTSRWGRPILTPSTPVAVSGMVYVGSGDGRIYELDLVTGSNLAQRVANTGQPGIVGDPTIDVTLMRILVSTTDQRMYAFGIPF